MPQNIKQLMVYDIADKQRLQRIYRRCSQSALPLQNSVFLYQGGWAEWQHLWQDLQKLLQIDEDSLWVFRLDNRLYCRRFGKKILPDGVILTGDLCLNALIT